MNDNGSAPVPGTSARTGARNTKRVRAKRFDPSTVVANGRYDLTEFIAKYGLQPTAASEIFERIGPSRRSIDRHMTEQSRPVGAAPASSSNWLIAKP